MYQLIVQFSSSSQPKVFLKDDPDKAVAKLEAMIANCSTPTPVDWYTVLDASTGELVHTALLNERF